MSWPDDLSTINKLREIYDEGKPLFTHDVLEEISRHMEQGKQSVYIPSDIGEEKENALTIDEEYCSRCPEDRIPRLGIGYQSFERMTILRPNSLDRCHVRPVYTMLTSITRNLTTPEELQEAFNKYRKEWLEGKTRLYLLEQIAALTPEQTSGITKIVGIGLGALTNHERSKNPIPGIRAFVQHAAIQTIADVLKKQNGGREVECYAQDPENDQDVAVQFLRTIGITSLSDPKGFLEIDGNTFVVSVCPNVPVRQIVCDIARPRAMLWDIIKRKECTEWRQELMDGELTWISPYTTDPVSDRVVEMAERYTEFPFKRRGRLVRRDGDVCEEGLGLSNIRPCPRQSRHKIHVNGDGMLDRLFVLSRI